MNELQKVMDAQQRARERASLDRDGAWKSPDQKPEGFIYSKDKADSTEKIVTKGMAGKLAELEVARREREGLAKKDKEKKAEKKRTSANSGGAPSSASQPDDGYIAMYGDEPPTDGKAARRRSSLVKMMDAVSGRNSVSAAPHRRESRRASQIGGDLGSMFANLFNFGGEQKEAERRSSARRTSRMGGLFGMGKDAPTKGITSLHPALLVEGNLPSQQAQQQ
jgi:hypothetical protein